MRNYLLPAIIFIGLFFVSCGNPYMLKKRTRPNIIASQDMATIVIYRDYSPIGGAYKMENFINTKFIGELERKQFIITKVQPGEYYIIATAKIHPAGCAKINALAGKTYYLRERFDIVEASDVMWTAHQGLKPSAYALPVVFTESDPATYEKESAGFSCYECCKTGVELPTLKEDDYKNIVNIFEKKSKKAVENPNNMLHLQEGY